MKRLRSLLIGMFLIGIGYLVVALWMHQKPVSPGFEMVETLSIYNISDVGVAYLDDDDLIDRWTTNHSALQWVGLGKNAQTIQAGPPPNAVGQIGWYNDPTVPDFEASADVFAPDKPVRVFFSGPDIVFERAGLAGAEAFEGQIDVPWRLTAKTKGGAAVALTTCDTMPRCYRASFSLPEGGRVEVRTMPPLSDGFPIRLHLDPKVPLDQIGVGRMQRAPATHSFTYRSRDRHGIAMTTLGPEQVKTAFVARGGARGRLAAVDPVAEDELFQWTGNRYEDQIVGSGIEKMACPGRQSAWHDVNDDGLQDLYVVCGRGAQGAANSEARNQLHIQVSQGKFENQASAYGLDIRRAGIFRILPRRQTHEPRQLLWVARTKMALYQQQPDKTFVRLWEVPRAGRDQDKVALMDVQADGIMDAFVFSKQGNQFFAIKPEGPDFYDIEALGLPLASDDGGFSDFDGDGQPEILAVPQGIYQAQEAGYARQDWLDLSWVPDRTNVRLAIYDHNADGRLDVWVLARDGDLLPRVFVTTYNKMGDRLRSIADHMFFPGMFRPRYFSAVLYENQVPGAVPLRRVSGTADELGKGTGAITWSGMAEHSRFSQTHFDVYLP